MAKLQAELKQSKPFDFPLLEAYLSMQRTTDLISRPVERVFGRHKFTTEQFNVLRILRGAEPDGRPTLDIGKRMITRASNVTRIIDRLEAKGLVTRARREGDRRVVNVQITPAGLQFILKIQPQVDAAIRDSMKGLGEADAARLTVLLEKLRAGMERGEKTEP